MEKIARFMHSKRRAPGQRGAGDGVRPLVDMCTLPPTLVINRLNPMQQSVMRARGSFQHDTSHNITGAVVRRRVQITVTCSSSGYPAVLMRMYCSTLLYSFAMTQMTLRSPQRIAKSAVSLRSEGGGPPGGCKVGFAPKVTFLAAALWSMPTVVAVKLGSFLLRQLKSCGFAGLSQLQR